MASFGTRGWHPRVPPLSLLLVCALLGPLKAQRAAGEQRALRARMTEFLRALPDDRVQDTTRRFFPISGHWTYTRTVHLKGGGVFVNRWTLPAAETSLLFGFGERPPVNPVRESFDLNPERQKPGLLLDVIMRSGDEWRLVGGNRFVPPFLTASSAIFVEWRKEGDTWVINAFGDEWFDGDHLPDWY